MKKTNKTLLLLLLFVALILCVSCSKKGKKNVDFDELVEEAFEEYADDNDLELLEIEDEDFDNDGKDEHIGFFTAKDDDKNIMAVLCARELKNDIEVYEFKNKSGYKYESYEIIELQDSDKQFVKLNVTNHSLLAGVAVLEVKEDGLEQILEIADPSAMYDAYLYDDDDDGAYEGGIMRIDLLDSQCHIIEQKYEWDGEKFSDCITNLIYENAQGKYIYPSYSDDVVIDYMQACYIEELFGIDMSEEINQLLAKNAETIDVLSIIDEVSIYNTDISFIVSWDILLEYGEFTNVVVTGDEGELSFEVIKEDDLWKIESISEYEPLIAPTVDEKLDGYITTEDGKTYYVCYTYEAAYWAVDTKLLIHNDGPDGDVVFDIQEKGQSFYKSDFEDNLFTYEDRNKDGIKELYFAEDAQASDPPRQLIINYKDGEFYIAFYDRIDEFGYADINGDGTPELYGITTLGGQTSYDLGFATVFTLKDGQYYVSYELTKYLSQAMYETTLEEYKADNSIEMLNELVGYAVYNMSVDEAKKLIDEHADEIDAYIASGNDESNIMYIMMYEDMSKIYKERWDILLEKDGTLAINRGW